MQLVATCLFGLEKQLGEEIDALGLKRIETIDGRITFEGDELDIARANIFLRCAQRVLIKLGSFSANTFTELFDGTKALEWDRWIGKIDEFPVSGHSIRSKLTSIPDCQGIVKKAIVDKLSSVYGIRWFSETGVKYKIEFFILKDIATLMIDTTGPSLHKRGYRPSAGIAPLRETLAAAIAMSSRPKEDTLFWDPFCGSGTIAIEAAMIACNIAPGLNREFSCETFPQITPQMWDLARDQAVSGVIKDSKFEAWASDIDEDLLDMTYDSAVRAGVENNLNIFSADATKIKKPDGRRGTIVCNPPYGERMGETAQVEELYRNMGKTFRTFEPWHVYVITSCEYFERLYGRRADKKKKLYNGLLPCQLFQFFKPFDENNMRVDLSRKFDNRNNNNRKYGRKFEK